MAYDNLTTQIFNIMNGLISMDEIDQMVKYIQTSSSKYNKINKICYDYITGQSNEIYQSYQDGSEALLFINQLEQDGNHNILFEMEIIPAKITVMFGITPPDRFDSIIIDVICNTIFLKYDINKCTDNHPIIVSAVISMCHTLDIDISKHIQSLTQNLHSNMVCIQDCRPLSEVLEMQ